jgi:hypothetical protein
VAVATRFLATGAERLAFADAGHRITNPRAKAAKSFTPPL